VNLSLEIEQEAFDGRWIAEVTDLPGVMVYGESSAEAIAKVKALALLGSGKSATWAPNC
jgi:predicted RNase H-like HicB family nuclease